MHTNKNKHDQNDDLQLRERSLKITGVVESCYTLCTPGAHLSASSGAIYNAAILEFKSLTDLTDTEN